MITQVNYDKMREILFLWKVSKCSQNVFSTLCRSVEY